MPRSTTDHDCLKCDACDQVYGDGFSCDKCKFTVHWKCAFVFKIQEIFDTLLMMDIVLSFSQLALLITRTQSATFAVKTLSAFFIVAPFANLMWILIAFSMP